jgi:uncharacterized protein YecE (DUF72 family)
MEFGRVEISKLQDIDFTLPVGSFLPGDNNFGGLRIYVGCAKWAHAKWIGRLYPAGTDEKLLLQEYARHFNSIEFGASFYDIPSIEKIAQWRAQVAGNPGFKFCPKFPQSISHVRRLKNADELTRRFYERIAGFGNHLGPLVLQLMDNFSPKSLADLKAYLAALPKEFPVFLEVRNKDWFTEPGARKELFGMLRDLQVGAVITDAAGRRDCVHMEVTTRETMIRFVGNDLHRTDYTRIDAWVKRIKEWKAQGLEAVWFFIHELDETNSPEMADYLISRLNVELGTQLQRPGLIK